MDLTEWARAQGIHVTTAYRWYREDTLPVPARNADRPILVSPDTAAAFPQLRSRLPTLWSKSYFAASAVVVSAETVRRYIDTQSERPRRKEKVKAR